MKVKRAARWRDVAFRGLGQAAEEAELHVAKSRMGRTILVVSAIAAVGLGITYVLGRETARMKDDKLVRRYG